MYISPGSEKPSLSIKKKKCFYYFLLVKNGLGRPMAIWGKGPKHPLFEPGKESWKNPGALD